MIVPSLIALLAPVGDALAHLGPHTGDAPVRPPLDVWRTWAWEPVSVVGLALTALVYGHGLARTWRRTAVGRGVRRADAACFVAGWLALVVALLSPLHPLGQWLFFVHMTQHEALMLVAAPLLVLGRPMPALLHGLPRGIARTLGRASKTAGWRRTWRALTTPLVAFVLHALVLWIWHVPRLFQATLESELVHAAQHATFLASALLFWWAVLEGRRTAASHGVAVLCLFTTALHSGLLGALLTFATRVWYPAYARTAPAWGWTPLEDQQLGGLVMWVPACLVYLIAGLALFAAWLRESERRVVRHEALRVAERAT